MGRPTKRVRKTEIGSSEMDDSLVGEILTKSIPVDLKQKDHQPHLDGRAGGQEYLLNGLAAFEAKVEQEKLCAFEPEITFRSQTYSTFKLLFNQFYSGY